MTDIFRTDTCSCPKVGCERMRKFKFVCLDEECLKDAGPCVIELYSETEPDWPNWCPWEFEPSQYKYHPWHLIKE